MSDAFYGEIRIFAGTYAPQNWACCDGGHLQINSNQALYSLLGTTYGGDGANDFALPDLRGRVPVHKGQGPGLTSRPLGQSFGTETVTLAQAQLPLHNHPMQASMDPATASAPSSAMVLAAATSPDEIYAPTTNQTKIRALAAAAVTATGGYFGQTQPHANIMPSLCLNFIICLLGIYPERS